MRSSKPLVFNAAPTSAPGFYSFKAKGSEAEIIIYGDIGDSWFGGVTAKQFADDLKAAGNVATINLRLNSAGGDVFEGLTIYRRLVDHKAKIVVHIDGIAASIASVIAMAGDEIRIAEAGQLMIHNAWGIALGDADKMRTMAALLDTTSASLRDVYTARTSNTADQVTAWMDAETWFTGEEAKKHGFADHVVENMRMAARLDTAKHQFKNIPKALTETPDRDSAAQRIASMQSKLRRNAA